MLAKLSVAVAMSASFVVDAAVARAEGEPAATAPQEVAPPEVSPEETPIAPPPVAPSVDPRSPYPSPCCVEQAPPPCCAAPARHARRHHRSRIFAPGAVSLMTGGGVGEYFGRGMAFGDIEPGAAWDARLVIGTSSVLAIEAGYQGSTNKIDITGSTAYLNSNGIDGALRLQLPFRVQPYVFGGVGWNHMSVSSDPADPVIAGRLRGSDEQLVFPAGGGLALYAGRHATVDLRGSYRLITRSDIQVDSPANFHQWIAQARVGYTF
jgi:hypothetical protein